MRYSSVALLAILASASAFVPSQNAAAFLRSTKLYSLDDLESKLLAPPEEAKPKKSKPAPKPKPAKVQKPKPAPKPKPEKAKPKFELLQDKPSVPAKAAKPAPAKKTVAAKKPAPAVEKKPVAKKPVVTKKAAPVVLPKPKPAPEVTAEQDPLAVPGGILLGSAPLIALPAAIAVLGRETLVNTLERREKIQQEIAAIEAAKAKQAAAADVDGGELTKALVSYCRK